MTDKHSLSQPERRNFSPYVMIWALLATLSLAYLMLLFLQPGSVSRMMGGSQVPEDEMRAIAAAASAVPDLRESVGQARMDIDELKAELADQAARDRELVSRIAALEARPQDAAGASEASASSTSAGGPDKRAERQPAKPSSRLPRESKDDSKAATPAPKVAAKKAAPPLADDGNDIGLETGSVAGTAPPVSFGPAVVTPAAKVPPKSFGLQVGTAPSVDSLRVIWNSLSVTHSESLGSFQPRYVSGSDPSGGNYDLVVGPVASAGEAKRLCKELTLKGTPCRVGDYTGNAF